MAKFIAATAFGLACIPSMDSFRNCWPSCCSAASFARSIAASSAACCWRSRSRSTCFCAKIAESWVCRWSSVRYAWAALSRACRADCSALRARATSRAVASLREPPPNARVRLPYPRSWGPSEPGGSAAASLNASLAAVPAASSAVCSAASACCQWYSARAWLVRAWSRSWSTPLSSSPRWATSVSRASFRDARSDPGGRVAPVPGRTWPGRLSVPAGTGRAPVSGGAAGGAAAGGAARAADGVPGSSGESIAATTAATRAGCATGRGATDRSGPSALVRWRSAMIKLPVPLGVPRPVYPNRTRKSIAYRMRDSCETATITDGPDVTWAATPVRRQVGPKGRRRLPLGRWVPGRGERRRDG